MIDQIDLQFILNHIPSFIFWKDRNSVYMGCNMNFARSAGFSHPREVVGKTDFDLPWSEEESLFFRKIDQEVMTSGMPQLNIEEPQTIEGGHHRWLLTNKIPLRNSQGEVTGVLGTYEDITERKQMALKLEEQATQLKSSNERLHVLNRKLIQQNEQLEEFTYIATHDLKEPLRTINGYSGLLQRQDLKLPESSIQQGLAFLQEASQRMSQLVTGLMNYASIGRTHSQSRVDCNVLLEQVLRDCARLIQDTQAQIHLDQLPILIGYREELECLFKNLMENALSYRKQEVSPIISLSSSESATYHFFTLSDNGIGIPEAHQRKIFQVFRRLHRNEKYPGVGIGLAMCKKIVELHEGEICVDSREGEGSIFTFSLKKSALE